MALTKVIMPQMGESVAEGTVAKWLKKSGDRVEKDENILEISTDKIDVEVPAPAPGFLVQILVREGETVEVGTPLAVIADNPDEAAEIAPIPAPAGVTKDMPPPPQPAPSPTMASRREQSPEHGDKRRFYTPVVLRMAAEHGIHLDSLTGTGMGGRITKKDVQAYLDKKAGEPAEPTPAAVAGPGKIAAAPADRVEIVPMSNVRKRTAEHMIRSVQTSAHVTSMQETDLTAVVRYREAVKDEFRSRNGFPLTYLAIIARETVEAIKEYPYINSSVDGDSIVLKRDINLGIAVALPDDTLIVPVIKNAGRLSVAGIAEAVYDLAERARARKLTLDDIQGGTFTITNHGSFGSVFGTPIINQPQVAILGTGAIRKRPWVVEGDAIAIRHIMVLSLSYDHRIIDGAYGGRFCRTLAERLEGWEPSRM